MSTDVLPYPPLLSGYYEFGKEYLLRPNIYMVFGSNMKGIHGAGAAKTAAKAFGAQFGVGEGYTGRSYAIPTKTDPYTPRSIDDIAKSIKQFVAVTDIATLGVPDEDQIYFYVTPVGTGLAGFPHEVIAPLFKRAVNCWFPHIWKPYLGEHPGLNRMT